MKVFDELHVHLYQITMGPVPKLVKTFHRKSLDDLVGHDYSQLSRDVAALAVSVRGNLSVSVYGRRYRTESFDTVEFLSHNLDMPRPWTIDQVSKVVFSVIQRLVFRTPKGVS